MLKLAGLQIETRWLDIHTSVRVQVRPCTVAAIIVARAEAGKVFRADPDGDNTHTSAQASSAMVRALARFAIVAWEGICGEDDQPAAVTPDAIDALMSLWPAYDAFERLYVGPALMGEPEKNA